MKLLLCLMLSVCSVQAELLVKRQGEGYIFSFVESGVQYCWGMPDLVDLNYFDPSWMSVHATAARYGWPIMTDPDAISSCNSVRVYRTFGRKMFHITPQLTVLTIMEIPDGLVCGEKVGDLELVRTVTYQNRTGMALCN